jgi:Flp pilus assembly protein TadD
MRRDVCRTGALAIAERLELKYARSPVTVSPRKSKKSAGDAEILFLKSATLQSRAQRLAASGRYREAELAFRRSLRMAERSRLARPVDLARLLNDYGVVCKYTGRLGLARRLYCRALKLARTQGPGAQTLLAVLYHNLGAVEHACVRNAAAVGYARRGIRIRKIIRPRDTIALAADEAALGAILADLDRTSEARTVFLRALRRFRRGLGPKHYEVGAVLANLGTLQSKAGRLGAAERSLRSAVSILEKAIGNNHPRIASAVNNLGVICARREGFDEADALYRRALKLLKSDSRSGRPGAALVKENLKKLHRRGTAMSGAR